MTMMMMMMMKLIQKKSLHRSVHRGVHRGLGHPCQEIMLKTLRAGNASRLVCTLAREFECGTCQESARPKPWRLAAPPRELSFNEVIGVDTFTLKCGEHNVDCLNVISWGSRYQMIVPLPANYTSMSIREAYRRWTTCFGAPGFAKSDLGREFRSDFAMRCSTDGTILDPASLEAPTQNSITEREGKSFKMIFYKALHEYGEINDIHEAYEMIATTTMMKNRLSHRGGYSPVHRVLGMTPHMPGEIMRGDDGNHAHTHHIS